MAYGRKRAYGKRGRGRGRRAGRRYRKGGRRGGRAMVSKVSPFPSRFYTKMRYVCTKTFNAGIVTAINTQFQCNGIYDPDITGTGHQPLGYDQIMGVIYNHAYVYKSHIVVDYMSGDNTAATCGSVVGINISDNTSPVLTLDTVLEQPHTTYKTMGLCYGNKAITRCSKWWTWKAFNGGNYFSDENKGLVGSNPTEAQYYNLFVQTPGGNQDPAACQAIVTITYYVCFAEPKQLGQS